ncbi:hypothetical protein L1286_16845 [Pseudoalteromonas sp. SMS1]|uniref:hypothetical protein n=1 Tax=Pseudoalteromonas sp. SMS1 TaxID=2908894 RepID=UPI001F36C1C1|nr:hypothetical protein [Pseudoalteromonas sp. SMS1]MCF2859153.1 hypothetical protein [Pseudoalteromonas sp. SMS1]
MKLLVKVLTTALMALAVTSCANLSTYKNYKNKKLSDDLVAKIRPSTKNSVFTPGIASVRNTSRDASDKKTKSVGGAMAGYPVKMNLLPGRYVITFYCFTGNTYAFPSAEVVVEEGSTYYSRCFNAPEGKVGVEVYEAE